MESLISIKIFYSQFFFQFQRYVDGLVVFAVSFADNIMRDLWLTIFFFKKISVFSASSSSSSFFLVIVDLSGVRPVLTSLRSHGLTHIWSGASCGKFHRSQAVRIVAVE
jgi:hypothetical protein